MEENKLKELLDKYYDGDTTPEEELEIKRYFSGDDIFPGYEAEKEIFVYYSEMEKITVPSADFEMIIIKSLADLEKIKLKNIKRKRYITLFSAAATILIMIGSWLFLLH